MRPRTITRPVTLGWSSRSGKYRRRPIDAVARVSPSLSEFVLPFVEGACPARAAACQWANGFPGGAFSPALSNHVRVFVRDQSPHCGGGGRWMRLTPPCPTAGCGAGRAWAALGDSHRLLGLLALRIPAFLDADGLTEGS